MKQVRKHKVKKIAPRVRFINKGNNYHLISNNSGCPSADYQLTWLYPEYTPTVVQNPWESGAQN